MVLIVAACGTDGDDDPTAGADGGGDRAVTLAPADETMPASTDEPSSDSSSGATSPSTADDGASTAATGSTSTGAQTTSTATSTSSTGRDGPDLVDIRPVPILSARALGPDMLEITVEGGVEPCFIIDQVEVVETSQQLELTVIAGSEPDVICIQIVELHTANVQLDRPLGGRAVIDGTTGQPLDVAS